MKKLMRKLVLSSFALGLAVITLSTTTFAWYTANTDVSATDIVGQASTSGAALLMISEDGVNYGTSVEVSTETTKDLIPLEYNEVKTDAVVTGITFNDLGATATDASTNTGFLEFSLWFKLQSNTPKLLNMTQLKIENISGLKTKDVLAGAGHYITGNTSEGYVQPSTYQVDILRTLLVSTQVVKTQNATAGAAEFHLLNPEALCEIHEDDILTAGFNAHEYYNHVMELPDATTSKPAIETTNKTEASYVSGVEVLEGSAGVLSTPFTFGTLPTADTEATKDDNIKITFRIFINGWDLACFDAVQGQSIEVSLTFVAADVPASE